MTGTPTAVVSPRPKTRSGSLLQQELEKQFTSEMHRNWRADHAARRRIDYADSGRGCVGMGAYFTSPFDAIAQAHGECVLVPNEAVRWAAIRDIPAGHFPGVFTLNRRDVNYASTATAVLRYGAPLLDFSAPTRDAWDFRMMPFGTVQLPTVGSAVTADGDRLNSDEHPKEFGVFSHISAAMTLFAFTAVDAEHRPVRRAWARNCRKSIPRTPVIDAHHWMPRAYSGFRLAQADRLFSLTTDEVSGVLGLQCPHCRQTHPLPAFDAAMCVKSVFESGDFTAYCPRCSRGRKWFLSDAVDCNPHRRFNLGFRAGMTDDVAQGLPLRSPEPAVYIGIDGRKAGGRIDLVRHRFRSEIDGASYIIALPANARVLVRHNQRIEGGEVWAKALPEDPSEKWAKLDRRDKWQTLAEVCGGRDMTGYLQKLWFDAQAIRLKTRPDVLLLPTALTAGSKSLDPVCLWWDMSPAAEYMDGDLEAFIFPPLRLVLWSWLKYNLPGETRLDAGIGDPRFSVQQSRRPCCTTPRVPA